MNQRRTLMLAVGAGALAAPFTSFAQAPAHPSGKPWRVGIMPGGLLAPRQFQWDAFRGRMVTLGYVEGKNVEYFFRAPAQEGGPFDDLATDLVTGGFILKDGYLYCNDLPGLGVKKI